MGKNFIKMPINSYQSLLAGFLKASEEAALKAYNWSGKKEKEKADDIASQAIRESFKTLPIRGRVYSGEGIKDNAPGIFEGEILGENLSHQPILNICLDPIDGTSNLSQGKGDAISCIAGMITESSFSPPQFSAFYGEKITYCRKVAKASKNDPSLLPNLNDSFSKTIEKVAISLKKKPAEIKIRILNRPRNQHFIDEAKKMNASIHFIQDGDILGAIAPCLEEEDCDIYAGIGGIPEGCISAIALSCLGGEIQMREWEERKANNDKIYFTKDLARNKELFFSATAIHNSSPLNGIKEERERKKTHSLLISNGKYEFIEKIH